MAHGSCFNPGAFSTACLVHRTTIQRLPFFHRPPGLTSIQRSAPANDSFASSIQSYTLGEPVLVRHPSQSLAQNQRWILHSGSAMRVLFQHMQDLQAEDVRASATEEPFGEGKAKVVDQWLNKE
ncbi:hypothetical protein PENPOL_c002G04345 [Penicillium polonicum]|uniref:Uncharacterized protein n=1 Tax=Penicillium polonicum TaxID=60169 RepID=A0A1V6NZ00_PENPO|nr:hypothetical protein PENPOL_c002G04345 [Penicillium polonicum]